MAAQRLTLFLVASLPVLALSIAWTEFRIIESALVAVLNTAKSTTDTTANGRVPGDTPAAWVRASFHDAFSFTPSAGTGGVHGCLLVPCTGENVCERTLDENRGLEAGIEQLLSLYSSLNLASIMSKADFLHFAAKTAVEFTSGRTISITFNFGRTDCATNPLPAFPNTRPGAEINFAGIQAIFVDKLGFTWPQTVSLIGSHALGRAQVGNLGYNGQWTITPNTFSNIFFQNLVNLRWFRQLIPAFSTTFPPRNQWTSPDLGTVSMMLDTDIEMVWEIFLGNPTCNITQDGNTCGLQFTTEQIARNFAASNSVFLSTYGPAFQIMQELGTSGLAAPTGTDPGFGFTGTTTSPSPSPSPSPAPAAPASKGGKTTTPAPGAPAGKGTTGKI